ncbi:glycosyltransferase family 4 protein [Christiangramia fulva]|nr:glycosyltransferase family 4 protein [Christiangramia fulva]
MVIAIKLGYEVRILTEEICDINQNANQEIFEEFGLKEKLILEDYEIPVTKLRRTLKAVGLILKRPDLLGAFLKFYHNCDRKGFLPIYQFYFYTSFYNYDIIHIQFGTNKSPVDVLKKTGFLKSRIITSFHGHDLHFPINNMIPAKGYYDDLFKIADILVCNTPFLKRKLKVLNAPEQKIRIVPVTVNTRYFKPVVESTKKNDEVKLITIGRLDELKGQAYGIKAVDILIKKGLNVKYILAGTGEYQEKLKKLVGDLGLNQSVYFKGRVSQSQVCRLLQESDIFLMTSVTNDVGMQESQGLVTAEAQACGLPIVAFDTGGVKYTLINGKTGFLCKEKDLKDFSSKIEMLIKDSVLREEMGINARKFIEEEYSEVSVMDKWKEIYG